MSRGNPPLSTIRKTEQAAHEYLDEHDNGRGETYFRASMLVENESELDARTVGRALSELETRDLEDIEISAWGTSKSTKWQVRYIDSGKQ
jgi:hypothetical protein